MKRFILLTLVLTLFGTAYAKENDFSKQATAFYSDNNQQKTMELILQINESDRSAQDWLLLGNVLADKGEIDNAVFMYRKALATDPKYYRAYYNIGNYHMTKGQYVLAIENYKKASKLKSDNPYIFYNLACAYIKQNDYKKARANLNKAIMYKSNIPDFHYNLAYVYKKLGKDKLAETYFDNYTKLIEN